MTSITLTLSGKSSSLHAEYFPPIDLGDVNKQSYECGLINLETWNTIPNIDNSNNEFYYRSDENIIKSIVVPHGAYEIDDLGEYLKDKLQHEGVVLQMIANKNTSKCEIQCSKNIIFDRPNSLGPLLGYDYTELVKDKWHSSISLPTILKVNVIRVECDIVKGAYFNNESVHTIHEFSPNVPPGYKIVEVPRHLIYFPITVQSIHEINISLRDQENELINFRNEVISVRIHIRPVKYVHL